MAKRKIDFYEQDQINPTDRADEGIPQAVIMKPQKPVKLPVIPTFKIQKLELERENDTIGEVKQETAKPSKKKAKK